MRQTVPADGQPTVLNASGYVTARLQSTVSSKVTGRIVEVLVEEGMAVAEGQVLARLDDTTERSYLALAEAQLGAQRGALAELEVRYEEAQLDLDRQRRLLAQRLIGQADLDAAQAEADSLAARIRQSARAGRRCRARDRRPADRAGGHRDTRAVQRRRHLEGRAAGRDDLAGQRRRGLHAHGRLHHRRHVVAGDRGRRQRELHQPRLAGTARGRHPRRLSGLGDSGQRHHDHPGRGPPACDGPGADRVRGAGRPPASCPTWG